MYHLLSVQRIFSRCYPDLQNYANYINIIQTYLFSRTIFKMKMLKTFNPNDASNKHIGLNLYTLCLYFHSWIIDELWMLKLKCTVIMHLQYNTLLFSTIIYFLSTQFICLLYYKHLNMLMEFMLKFMQIFVCKELVIKSKTKIFKKEWNIIKTLKNNLERLLKIALNIHFFVFQPHNPSS